MQDEKFQGIIELCEMPEDKVAGRATIKMTALKIHNHNDFSDYNSNGIHWEEEYVNDNIKSLIGCPYTACWMDEESQIPSDHGDMSYTEDGEVRFTGVTVGSIQEALIEDRDIDGETQRVLTTIGYIYKQRYGKFYEFLKNQIANGTIYGSIEINGKGDSKTIEYLYGNKNEDGSPKMGRCPKVFDFSGLSILYLTEPADKSSQIVEVNSKQDNLNINNKQGKEDVDALKNKNIIKSPQSIELNELSYEDIAVLITRAFNKVMYDEKGNDSCYYYDYYIHRFYPQSGRVVIGKWGAIAEYYMTTYTVQNSIVSLGEIIKVEEDWKPIENEQEVEVNVEAIKSIILKNKKEVTKVMDEKVVLELNQKLEDKVNEINSLNKSLEEKGTEMNTLNDKIKELEGKVTELNTTLVEVNKLLETEKSEKETLVAEVNSYKEEKAKVEHEKKIVEVNAYFENEITKNGFEDSEINSLKIYVEKVDLDGLKKAEAELCAKKFKELVAKNIEADSEINSKTDMFITIKEKEKKELPNTIPTFFN